MNRTRLLALAIMIGIGVTACSSSKPTTTGSASTAAGSPTTASTASSPPAANTTSIAIKGFTFKPSPAHAKVGDTITVTNGDGTDHTLTADDASFTTGKFSSGSKTITLAKAGTFSYHCEVHNYMTGSIQVGS